MKIVALASVVSCLGARLAAQPTACSEDSQCPTSFYCEEGQHFCRECINCSDLQRVSPFLRDGCVKSVIDCGACYDGLEEDLRLGGACVPPDKRSDDGDGGLPVPWIIGIVVSIFLFILVVALFVLKRSKLFSIFKIDALAWASGRSQPSGGGGGGAAQAQWDAAHGELGPPPPYNAVAASAPPPAYRPAPSALHLPSSAPTVSHGNDGFDEESARPLIKRAIDEAADGPRESSDRQAATPFSTPSQYVRPPARGYGLFEEEESSAPTEVVVHDESTMESRWTPNETSNVVDAHTTDSGAGALVRSASATSPPQEAASAAAVAPRASAGAGGTDPPRAFRFFEENNRGRREGEGIAASPALFFNIQVNSVDSRDQSNNVNM